MTGAETAEQLRILFEAHQGEKAQASAVLDALARNPNSPSDVLGALLTRLPLAFCANPAAPLALLESPELLTRRHPARLLRMLRNPALPGWLIEALESHPAWRVADAARNHIVLGGDGAFWEWLEEKLTRRSATLRRWHRSGWLPAWLVERLEFCPEDARWQPMSCADWRMARPEAPGLRCALAAGLTDGKAIAAAARSYDPADRLGVALNPTATRQRLHVLKNDADTRVRAAAKERLSQP